MYIHVCIYIYMYVCVYVYIYIYTYIYAYICIYIYIYMCVCRYMICDPKLKSLTHLQVELLNITCVNTRWYMMHVYLFLHMYRYVRIWSERLSLLFNCKLSWDIYRSMYIYTHVSLYINVYVSCKLKMTPRFILPMILGWTRGKSLRGKFHKMKHIKIRYMHVPTHPSVFLIKDSESLLLLDTRERELGRTVRMRRVTYE